MKLVYLAIICLFFHVYTQAQINYSFAASTGTFNEIAGTSATLTSGGIAGASNSDEGFQNAVPIGFTFTYNGTNYTSVNISTNGFLSLGAALTSGSIYYSNNLNSGPSTPTGARPIIAPLWDDLDAQAANNITYTTTGSSPNRVFIVQWKNILWDYSALGATISFQVRLSETSNQIQFVYRQEANVGTLDASGGASIGISAASTGSGNFISLANATNSPTTSTTIETNSIITKPATGQVYTFTPVTQAANDASVTLIQTLGTLRWHVPTQVIGVVKNLGTNTLTNLQVSLNISGSNTFTNTKTIASLAPSATTTVTFDAFTAQTVGTNSVIVSVPNDDVNGNNTYTLSQTVSATDLNYCYSNAPSSILGNNAAIDFAAKFVVSTGTINNIKYYFGTAGVSYQAAIWSATGTGGTPGTLLWSSATNTTATGIVSIPVNPPVSITGGAVYVGIRQTTATSIDLGYVAEDPIRTGVFYSSTTGTWFDFAPINKFNLFIQPTIPTTLPVVLSSFSGNRNGSVNYLFWTTASEVNSKGFELQRSADGTNFTTLDFVNSKAINGNSAGTNQYTFTDAKPFAGTSYYRLKQMDKDGQFTLSSIVAVKGVRATNIQLAAVYPNPTTDKLTLSITSPRADKLTLLLSDITGRIVMNQTYQVVIGDNNISLAVSNLSKGSYTIRILCSEGCETAVTKFVKQ
jgi:hypothetical protein